MRRIAVLGLVLLAGAMATACGGGGNDGAGGQPDGAVTAEAVRGEIASQREDRGSLSEASSVGAVGAWSVSASTSEVVAAGTGPVDSASVGGSSPDGGIEDSASASKAGEAEGESPAAEGAREAGGASAVAAVVIVPAPATVVAAVEPKRPLVVLDAGHGGRAAGAVGFGVIERDSNLDFALRVEQLLLEAGFDVILTRRGEARTAEALDVDPDEAPGFFANRRDLQARVDLANAAQADLFVSIHSNAAEDPRASGVEVYWDGLRTHSVENERLALALQESVLESLAIATGFRAWDRGIREDTCWHVSARSGECSPLFILGPAQEIKRTQVEFFGLDPALLGFAPGQEVLVTRATEMPAVLMELLFVSNEFEAQVLKDETARQAIAIGIARGIQRFFREQALVAEQGVEDGAGAGSAAVVAGAG